MEIIQPTTASELQLGTRVLAIEERGMGAEINGNILVCTAIEPHGDIEWPLGDDRLPGSHIHGDAEATVTFRSSSGARRVKVELKASSLLLTLR